MLLSRKLISSPVTSSISRVFIKGRPHTLGLVEEKVGLVLRRHSSTYARYIHRSSKLRDRTVTRRHHKPLASMPESRSTEPLVWIDCEMTGLDLSKDTIMSLACFITDHELNLLDETGYEAALRHSQEQMGAMGEWCKVHHGKSGLTQACLDSTTTAETAATELLEYIQKYAPERKKALLAGNTVHADKAFLVKEPWTKVMKHLHHRILDVSAIKEAARRWAPVEVLKKSPQKAGKHEAKADILESIEEARYYKRVFFDRSSE